MTASRIIAVLTVLLIASMFSWSYASEGIMHFLMAPGLSGADRLAGIQMYFESWGLAGPLAYALVVTVEVILAPIPGTLLYLPGGVIFGWFAGGLASLAGNVVGAGAACQIMRAIGGDRLARYIEQSAVSRYEALIRTRGFWVVLLLRINPLTSSDLVSYAAGLTKIPVWKVMAGTLFGMAPLCFAQAYFAQEIFAALPSLVYPIVFLGLLYTAFVVRILVRLRMAASATQQAAE